MARFSPDHGVPVDFGGREGDNAFILVISHGLPLPADGKALCRNQSLVSRSSDLAHGPYQAALITTADGTMTSGLVRAYCSGCVARWNGNLVLGRCRVIALGALLVL